MGGASRKFSEGMPYKGAGTTWDLRQILSRLTIQIIRTDTPTKPRTSPIIILVNLFPHKMLELVRLQSSHFKRSELNTKGDLHRHELALSGLGPIDSEIKEQSMMHSLVDVLK